MVIGWATNVNQNILDSTTGTVGEAGFKEQTLDNGLTERRLTTFVTPRTYNVTMDFDWLEKDENGLSEFDRFEQWFAYRHQSGSNPFWFDSISRFNVNGSLVNASGNPVQCQYKINKGYQFSKSGYSMRVTMVWTEVYSGLVTYTDPVSEIDHINAVNGKVLVYYTEPLTEVPTLMSVSLKYIDMTDTSKDPTDISDYSSFTPYRVTASNKEATFYVKELTSGTYKIVCDYENSQFKNNVVVII